MATHYDIVSVDSVPSTQDEASQRLAATRRAALVIADHQVLGRGRQGRSWEEPDRGVFSSLALESDWPLADRAVITLCTAVALASSIESFTGISCDIKWPNDLLVSDAKIAGILVESTADVVVVGCGVNLWWPNAPTYAGALFESDPGPDVAADIAQGWADLLVRMLDGGPQEWPHAEYLRRSVTVGREVTWETGTGLAVGIAPGGGLIVDTGEEEIVLIAGEVHTRQGR